MRYNSEASSGYVYGDTGFYGFAFYLQSAWDFSGTSQQYQLFQMIADYTNDSQNSCGEDWQPSAMIWVAWSPSKSCATPGSPPPAASALRWSRRRSRN